MPAPTNKGAKFPPRPLTTDEVSALIGACSKRAPTGVRNAALIELGIATGLRCSELLALKPRDIHETHVDVLAGKGSKHRVVAIRGDVPLLHRWMDRRQVLGVNGHHAVFCTLQGEPLEDSYIRHLFARLGRKAGVEARVHPHAMRHTHARNLLKAGASIEDIRAQLGHASLAVTSRYIAEVCPEDRIQRLSSL